MEILLIIFKVVAGFVGFVVSIVVLQGVVRWVKGLKSVSYEKKSKTHEIQEDTLTEDDLLSLDLNGIFKRAGLVHKTIEKKYGSTTDKLMRTTKGLIDKVVEHPPEFKLFPQDSNIKTEMKLRFHADAKVSLNNINSALDYLLKALHQKEIIEQPRGEVVQGELPNIFILRFFTKEQEEKERFNNMLIDAGLYKTEELNGRKTQSLVELKKAENGDLILTPPPGVVFTESEILASVPILIAYYKEDFDRVRARRDGESYIVRKKHPIQNFLPPGKNVLDKYEPWKKEYIDVVKESIETTYLPTVHFGRNQDDDGSPFREIQLNAEESINTLIGGTTGSGKTEYILSTIIPFLVSSGASIDIFDGKAAVTWDFIAEKFSKHKVGKPVESNPNLPRLYELYFLIQVMYQEFNRRKRLLNEVRADNYITYNKMKNEYALKPHILMIEEWGLVYPILSDDGNLSSPSPGSPHAMLMEVLKGGRSYGIFVWAVTQNIKDSEVPNDVKTFFPVRLIGKSDTSVTKYMGSPLDLTTLTAGEFMCHTTLGWFRTRHIFLKASNLPVILDKLEIAPPEKNSITYDEIFITTSDKKGPTIKDQAQYLKKFVRAEGYEVVFFHANPENHEIFMMLNKDGIDVAVGYIQKHELREKYIQKFFTQAQYHVLIYEGDLSEKQEREYNELKKQGVYRPGSFIWNYSEFTKTLNRMIEKSTDESFADKGPSTDFTETLMTMVEEEQGDGFTNSDLEEVEETPKKSRKTKKAE